MNTTITLDEAHFQIAAERARMLGQTLEEYLQDLIDIDSVPDDEPDVPLTENQKRELDRRYETFLANPDEGESWENVSAYIRARLRPSRLPG